MHALPLPLQRSSGKQRVPCATAAWSCPLRCVAHTLRCHLSAAAQFAMKRQVVGIWKCKACNKTQAGGAYVLK